MPNHVIIGAGPAGINAAETIRQFDSQGTITLISQERPYARMALPYFLTDEFGAEQLATASDEYLDSLRVKRRIGVRAAGIDTSARRVRLEGGEEIGFEQLLVAPGSTPVRPPIAGADGKRVHTLWTLDDARAVMGSARGKRPSAVIVGGGFIGLIVLGALHKRGWKLAVVEMEGHILPRMLDRRGAEAVEAWLREKGVEVYTGCTVEAISGARKKVVALAGGTEIRASAVILSTGVRPNIDFLKSSGIEVGDGVVVDAHMQTSVPGIYAAGDAAQGPSLFGGPPVVHAIQPTAVDHGRIAGANMAGRRCAYAGSLAMNILDVAGLQCTSFGRWQAGGDTTLVWNAGRPVYRKLVWEETRLVGAIMLGPAADTTMLTDVGMIKGLIQSQADMGRWKRYLNDRPWDLRRAYVASDAATKLLARSTVGSPSSPRGFRFAGRGPRLAPGPYHEALIGSRPAGFESLPPTPTPGIYKTPSGGREPEPG